MKQLLAYWGVLVGLAVVALLLITFGGCAFGPRASYDVAAMMQTEGQLAGIAMCGDVRVAVVDHELNGKTYRVFYSPDTGKAIAISYGEDEKPTEAVLGSIVLVNDKPVFTVVEVLTIEQAKAKYENPCIYLQQK